MILPNFLTKFLYFAAPSECTLPDSIMGFPTWYKYLQGYKVGNGPCSPLAGKSLDINDLTSINSLAGIGLAIVEILLRIAAMVAIAYIVYGGFLYLTSQGEPDRTKAAKDSILNAVIGLMITMIATVLVNFIGTNLSK